MNVLIVDDALEELAWIAAILRADGWSVHTAADGETACRLLEREDFRVVVTDWMMPGMDGLSLIDCIRHRGAERYVYTLLMTGRDTEEDCIKGLRAGADDFLVKPISTEVLKARLRTARRIADMQQELLDQQQRLRESKKMVASAYRDVKRELKHAANQQLATLPGGLRLPEGIFSDWRFRAATGLSGDHLNLFLLDGNRLAFYLFDVSGHGVGSALRSAALSELLRPFSSVMSGLVDHGPHEVLEQLNRHICSSSTEIEYLATIVLGLLDTRSGAMQLACAGHPSPLLLQADGSVNDVALSGLPLGISPEACFESFSARLMPGDALLMYSDGLTDCRNDAGEHLGHAALHNMVRTEGALHQPDVLAQLESGLDQWRGTMPLTDDVSLLLLGLTPEATVSVIKDLQDLKTERPT